MKSLPLTVVAAAMFALVGSSCAQSDADHDAHHPDNASAAQAPAPPPVQPPARGMMGQGNGGMMQQGATPRTAPGEMSGSNMMPMTGMMMGEAGSSDHMNDRLALVKNRLGITAAQTPKWNEFVAAASENAKAMIKLRGQMMSRGTSAGTLPQRLAEEDKAAEAHLKAMKKTTVALNHLYGVLSDEQKKIADGMVLGPMGMPMGMM
jgi:hypothetical protein